MPHVEPIRDGVEGKVDGTLRFASFDHSSAGVWIWMHEVTASWIPHDLIPKSTREVCT